MMENPEEKFNLIPEEKRQRKKERFIASPEGGGGPHEFEVEYWEILPGVWEKIYGTEKDLGPVKE